MTRRGIPTTYRGARFRSILEAKWAAMFDLLGWEWTYEPFEGDGYIPDFAIKSRDHPFLVEVKPLASLDELIPVARRAARRTAEVWRHDVIAIGLSPLLSSGLPIRRSVAAYGKEGVLTWSYCLRCNNGSRFRLASPEGARMPCSHLDRGPEASETEKKIRRVLEELWNRAGSSVQWRQQPW